MLAAATTTPCTVRELAMRSQVAWGAAAYTACRLVQRGQLVRVYGAKRKPWLVALPAVEPDAEAATDLAAALAAWRP